MTHKAYRAIIVDDEPAAVELLSGICRDAGIEVAGSTTNSLLVGNLLKEHQPDLVFLDIMMGPKNGLEVLQEISGALKDCLVVIVTAHKKYILDSFRNYAFDFLLKPVSVDDLKELMVRIGEKKSGSDSGFRAASKLEGRIKIPTTYTTYYFHPGEILYFQGDGKYTHIVQKGGEELITSKNLGEIEKLVPAGEFMRISKSHIVNLNYLSSTCKKSGTCTILAGEEEIQLPVSRVYAKDLL